MGTPLDVGAAAVGFASLGLLAFQGCVKGFLLISTAQNFGQDADMMRCALEFEQYRLFRWAGIVGLETKTPKRNLNWTIINDILKQLTSTDAFRTEYGLELLTTHDRLSIEDLKIPKKGVRRLMELVKPDFHNETARKLQKNSNIWKRLKWASVDREGIELLICDIARMVDRLFEVLDR